VRCTLIVRSKCRLCYIKFDILHNVDRQCFIYIVNYNVNSWRLFKCKYCCLFLWGMYVLVFLYGLCSGKGLELLVAGFNLVLLKLLFGTKYYVDVLSNWGYIGLHLVLRQRNFHQNFMRKFPETFGTKVWIFLTQLFHESFIKIWGVWWRGWRNFSKICRKFCQNFMSSKYKKKHNYGR